ncbi:hypothetical protein [Streptosporangium sp. G12]
MSLRRVLNRGCEVHLAARSERALTAVLAQAPGDIPERLGRRHHARNPSDHLRAEL